MSITGDQDFVLGLVNIEQSYVVRIWRYYFLRLFREKYWEERVDMFSKYLDMQDLGKWFGLEREILEIKMVNNISLRKFLEVCLKGNILA